MWTGVPVEAAVPSPPTPEALRSAGQIKIAAALVAAGLDPAAAPFYSKGVGDLLRQVLASPHSAAFRHTVNKREVPNYEKVIPYPRDLGGVRSKIETGKASWSMGPYASYDEFEVDVRLVVANCRCVFR